jgi:hypothetical protein
VVDLISTALESLSGSRNEAYRFSLARGLAPRFFKRCGADQPTAASCILVSLVDLISYSIGESLWYTESKLIYSLRQEVGANLRAGLSKILKLTSQLLPPVSWYVCDRLEFYRFGESLP